jgi:hemerythrin
MIEWKDSYSVDFDGIDDQHKKLIAIMAEVETAINTKNNNFSIVIDVVNKLEKYIKEHFSYEEVLMEKHAYPYAESHLQQHNELRYKVLSINYDYIQESEDFYKSTLEYLLNWLINHIMKVDRLLAEYLISKGVTETA